MIGHVVPGRWPNVRESPGGRILPRPNPGPGTPLVVLSLHGDHVRCITPDHLGYIWAEYVHVDAEPVDVAEIERLEARIAELEGAIADAAKVTKGLTNTINAVRYVIHTWEGWDG